MFGESPYLVIDVMLGFCKSFTKGSLFFIRTVVGYGCSRGPGSAGRGSVERGGKATYTPVGLGSCQKANTAAHQTWPVDVGHPQPVAGRGVARVVGEAPPLGPWQK